MRSGRNFFGRLFNRQEEAREPLLDAKTQGVWDTKKINLQNINAAIKHLETALSRKMFTYRYGPALLVVTGAAGLIWSAVTLVGWDMSRQKEYDNTECGKRYPAYTGCGGGGGPSFLFNGIKNIIGTFASSFNSQDQNDDKNPCRKYCTRYSNVDFDTFVPSPCQDVLANAGCPRSIDAAPGMGIAVGTGMFIAGAGIACCRNSIPPKDRSLDSFSGEDASFQQSLATVRALNISTELSFEEALKQLKQIKEILINERKSFLMGTHTRVGQDSRIRDFVNHPTFDRSLLKLVFNFSNNIDNYNEGPNEQKNNPEDIENDLNVKADASNDELSGPTLV